MEITIEQVDRLREKANVSYAQAKQALEFSGGNLLDALIYLEERGCVSREEGATYSTKSETPPPPPPELIVQTESREKKGRTVAGLGRTVVSWLIDNEVEVWRKGRMYTSVPVLIPLILLVCVFWFAVPVLIFALFFGFRYRFSGPNLDREDLNGVMDNVADTAANMGRQVMDELMAQHQKNQKRNREDK